MNMNILRLTFILLLVMLLQACSEPLTWHASDVTGMMPDLEFSLTGPDDELVEVTPKSIRLRKILLKEHERKREKNA